MQFSIHPQISDCTSLEAFFEQWKIGNQDLIITNEYVLSPHLKGQPAPCDLIYQEQCGSGEPSDEMVDAMLAAAGKQYQRIIAIGGGTVIDIAKLFVFGNQLSCETIFAEGAKLKRKSSLVIIPTTCGTGSEVTGISIIEFKKKHTKLGLALPALYADEAVLIPDMLKTLPYEVFATSSIDALIHSVESFVSPKANPFTQAIGRDSIERILAGYQSLARNEEKKLPEDMTSFLIASTMGGIAFGNAGCAAVHALSYPLGANYHVPHGKANYMVFEAVFAAYRELGAELSLLEKTLAAALGCDKSIVWTELFCLLEKVLPKQSLAELGADSAKCAEMAHSVVENQQRLLVNNPVSLDEEQIRQIFLNCL